MKHIRLLPTEKLSRLFTNRYGELKDHYTLSKMPLDSIGSNQNIYIISDEEINQQTEPCWCINTIKNTWDADLIYYQGSMPQYHYVGFKKIILTTDQELIDEGVQPIDGEFLKWFVKNPSCESVEVSYGVLKPFQNTDKGYMIHLPDNDVLEESKTKCYCGHTTYCDCGPEQELDILEVPMPIYKETIEEAAERFVENTRLKNPKSLFCEGAKWQEKRMKAREVKSPIVKQLLDETTPEELDKIDKQMKQTAVEWLKDQLESFGNKHELQVSWITVDELFEQAKARHKKELISFALKYATLVITQRTIVVAEEVYNETYGGK